MDIHNCRFCGGEHYGSSECPYICQMCGGDIRDGHRVELGRVVGCGNYVRLAELDCAVDVYVEQQLWIL